MAALVVDGTQRVLQIMERELQAVKPPTPQERLLSFAAEGSVDEVEKILRDPKVHLSPDDFGIALEKASEVPHLPVVSLLLQPEWTGHYAPPILLLSAMELVKHPGGLPAIKQIVLHPRFQKEVSLEERKNLVIEAIGAANAEVVEYLIGCKEFSSQFFPKDYTLFFFKTVEVEDSSCTRVFLNQIKDLSEDLYDAAEKAARKGKLLPYLEIIQSEQFIKEFYKSRWRFYEFTEIDVTPLGAKIDGPALKKTLSQKALGTLCAACARIGKLLLPPEQLSAVSSLDLRRAIYITIKFQQVGTASEIVVSPAFKAIATKHLTHVLGNLSLAIDAHPPFVLVLCALLTEDRLPQISQQFLQLLLGMVARCCFKESPGYDLFPLFQKTFKKLVSTKQFKEKISPRKIKDWLIEVATQKSERRDEMVQLFFTCGRYQEITPSDLFHVFSQVHPLPFFSFSQVQRMDVRGLKERNFTSLEELFFALTPLGNTWTNPEDCPGSVTKDVKSETVTDAFHVLKEVYPVAIALDSPLFVSHFNQLFRKHAADVPYSYWLGKIFTAAAGLGLWHIAQAIISSRLDEIYPLHFTTAVIYSVSGNRLVVFINTEVICCKTEENMPLNVGAKRIIAGRLISSLRFKEVELRYVLLMIEWLAQQEEVDLLRLVLACPQFAQLSPNEKTKHIKTAKIKTSNHEILQALTFPIQKANTQECVVS